ncbi:MAG: LamG domain-containing protein [Nanoarchaeota archaeon]
MKKGVSTVIATVLIVFISIITITFLAVMVYQFYGANDFNDPCSNADVSLKPTSGFSCVDPSNNVTSLNVKKGENDVEVSGLEFYLSSEGNSKKYERTFSLPKNSEKTFYFVTDDRIDEASVAPIVRSGNTEKTCEEKASIRFNEQPCDVIEDLSKEYVAIWKLDDRNFNDLTKTHPGNTSGNSTFPKPDEDRHGNVNASLYFNGYSDCLKFGNAENITPQGFTYAFWIKPRPDIGIGHIFLKDLFVIDGAGTEGWWPSPDFVIIYNNSNFTAKFILIKSSTGSSMSIDSSSLKLNEWHHIVATYDEYGIMKLYSNGGFQANASFPFSNSMNSNTTSINDGGYLIYESYHLGGKCNPASLPGAAYNGSIDDVRIYRRALSEEEVWQLYEETK